MRIKLRVKNLDFSYPSRQIFRSMCMEIERGTLVSILGPNGSGKSTLLKCIDRILTPQKGEIYVDEADISSLKRKDLAKKLSYVPQSAIRVFPHSVYDIVLMGRRPHLGWRSSEEDEERVWDVIELLGLEEIALSQFNELSGGQQQKVMIAQALVQDTDLMLLDEPTSNLDIWHQLDVMRIVSDLVSKRGITALMAVHDLNMAARYSDQIVLMKQGEIHAFGTPETVLTPDHIARVYEVEARVQTGTGTERPVIIPLQQVSEHGRGRGMLPPETECFLVEKEEA